MASIQDPAPTIEQNPRSSLTGGCTCGAIRYRIAALPLFVHCCHCSYCQRETGSAFALNALIESSCLSLLPDTKSNCSATSQIAIKPLMVLVPSRSGIGQLVSRCPRCFLALWSEYGGVPAMKFVRVGTLDEPRQCVPNIHIFTETKQAWVDLERERERGVKVCEADYDRAVEWPKESLQRRDKIME